MLSGSVSQTPNADAASPRRFVGRVKIQMFPLALAWKGNAGSLGWGALAPVVPPEARGPLAYAMGLRFVKLNKLADAKSLFRAAIADVPANSPLARLATVELAKLDGKLAPKTTPP